MTAAANDKPAQVYSEETARRLIRTFLSSLAFGLLICWFEIIILRPASDMEKEMVGLYPNWLELEHWQYAVDFSVEIYAIHAMYSMLLPVSFLFVNLEVEPYGSV